MRPFRLAAALLALCLVASACGRIEATAGRARPLGCVEPNKRMHLYAEQLPDAADGSIRLGWGLSPGTATIPGPTIELTEGDCVAITVVNDIPVATLAALRDDPRLGSGNPSQPLGVSLHVHGVKYTQDSDGTLETDSWVRPGQSRTYTWYAAPRVSVGKRVASLGTAGYWWYHDHIIGTSHGTGGIGSGLVGGLVVRRPGDPEPDRPTNVVVMGPDQTINFQRYPNTPRFVARRGERVEFLVIGVGDEFHTFHLHGHVWADTRTGFFATQEDETQLIDVRTIGPSETFGFQVIAGESVGAGSWMLHCHVQVHSDRGMVTFFDVLEPNQPLPVAPIAPANGGHHLHG
ncbi:MAG TPA: multicopper oxidase domain-containing protein [Actinomycetota bacterium]|nr:multicopper oxidase domain-containing protein [Actinomycetota bacterium]